MEAMSIDQLTAEVMALPPEKRWALGHLLIDSVPGQEEDAELDPEEFEPEYMQEIHRRIEELDSGKVKGIPWEEVQAKMRQEFGCD